MAGMRKEYNPNRAARRKRRPVIYIICEGKETETKYFRHFRTRNCLVDIVPISSKHKAAEHLVRHAKDMLKPAAYYPKDGDRIWCVFDCDDNTDEALKNAAVFAEQAGYGITFSNPCFEYWYLLHFVQYNAHLKGADEAIRLLKEKGRLENYEKSLDVFFDLLPHQQEAIKRAEKRSEQLRRDGTEILTRASNPATTVHKLVTYLIGQSR